MKNTFKRSICLLCVLVMLAMPMLAFSASADEGYGWILTEDRQELIRSDGKKFTYVDVGNNLYLDPRDAYQYENKTNLGYIYARSLDSEVVWISDGYGTYSFVYATPEGLIDIMAFSEGRYGGYKLTGSIGSEVWSYLDTEFAESLSKAGEETIATFFEVDVRALAEVPTYSIAAFDGNETFSVETGRVFLVEGTYYYLNYATLTNANFDADGNFSYRQGTVKLMELEGTELATVAAAVENMQRYEYTVTVEGEAESMETFLWVVVVFVGFILPIVPVVLGLCLASSQKRGRPRYWYALAILGAVWILLSIVLVALLL